MNQTIFRAQVRDALSHLYDQAYLETQPLASVFKVDRTGESRGTALQRILLDAIQELRPSADLPYTSLAWRKYRYLFLRYAQAMPLPEIGNDLGISLRQARRYSYEALAAVTVLLWDRYCGASEDSGESPSPDASEPQANPVDQEVVRVEAQAHETPVSLGELLRGVVSTVRPLAERRGIPLSITLASCVPTAIVDRAVLRQVLLNVLTLSLEVGSRALELSVEPSSDGAEARILVRAALVEDHHAATEQITVDDRWYIARHLLQAQHGHAEILPVVDDGITICLRVRSIPSSKLLMVDDNQDVIALYRRYLSDSPYQILAVSDSSTAAEIAAAEQPVLILLDVMMPAQDGWEVLQFLKSQPETQSIPVLVCSILKERELALALGASDLLVKPVTRQALLQAIAQHYPR